MDVKETIKKLLEKSDPLRNDSLEERTACYEKAVLLMKKHNLSVQDLTANETVYTRLEFKTSAKSRQRHQLEIALTLNEFYPVELILNGAGQLSVMGQKCNIDDFFRLFYKLEEFFLTDVKALQELFDNRHDKLIARRDYLKGFCMGVRDGMRYMMNKYAIVPVEDEGLQAMIPKNKKTIKSLEMTNPFLVARAVEAGKEAVSHNHLK